MKVTILGCGGSAGVPMVGGADGRGIWGDCDPTEPKNKRSRASIFLEMKNGENILVDTGPDIREQFLVNGFAAFRSIFYTHAHADHIAGLDEVRAINRTIKAPITAYGRAEVLEEVQERFGYIFQPWAGTSFYRAVVEAWPITPYETFEMGGAPFIAFQQKHGRGESTGLRFGGFAYSTDVVELDDRALTALQGVETWVVDCFQREPHCAHAWLERVLEWKRILEPKRIILTHMGPDMDWRWMLEALPDGVEPAWDGLSFNVPEPA